jgi:hydroxymethylpyrimidine pyrophosphatase-like HAD family hydrolase
MACLSDLAPGLLLPWPGVIFRALACDYDGTLATADRIGPAALEALTRAREAGLKLILVTGRAFFELTRVCERLDLFDAVVAENGGVIYYPGSGAIRDQGPPPPMRLLAELDRRGIWYQLGRVVVGAARCDEDAVQEALEAAGISRELIVNRSALMLLPAGISKGTGACQVIRDLGFSFHDVLALGDAENDSEFFSACGWAGCPGDAVPGIRERADWIFQGEDGRSVAAAITGPILSGRLPVHLSPRHRLTLGWATGSAAPVTIPARGVNLLVQGDPVSGKSWLVGALVERLVADQYAVCVIDPEGDYGVLRDLPGVAYENVDGDAAMARAVSRFDANPAACVVADLADLAQPDRLRVTEAGLRALAERRRRLGLPHWLIVDEAHSSLHVDAAAEAAAKSDGAGLCLASYRSSWIRPLLTDSVDIFVLARTTDPQELTFLRKRLTAAGVDGEAVAAALPGLPNGEFVLIQPGPDGRPAALSFVPAPRQTAHVRHLAKYADARVGAGRRFIFRHPDGHEVASAESLTEFLRIVERVDPGVLDGHARRGDFSRWARDVFSDTELGRQLRKTENRWARGELAELAQSLARPIRARYGA